MFMAANRARSDPSTVKGAQSTIYPPQPPLVMHYDLERSSRFHATSLENGMAPLMHPSPCMLRTDVGTSGCDGSPSCACSTGQTCNSCGTCANGTDPFVRIGYFYAPGGSGEVAAAGYSDPWGVMDGWVNEAAGMDGHRVIVDGGGYGLVGFGHAGGTSGACWPTFDVGDFGSDKPTPPKIASAAPKPISGPAGTFRVYATWNDPAAGAPKDLSAVVDGKCMAMTKELGDPKRNATYYADVPLVAGCHSVYALGHDSAAVRVTYPTTTAFTIPVGGGTCADEQAQPAADCDPGSGGGGTGGGNSDGGSGDGGGGGGTGGSGGGGGGTGGGGGSGTGGNGSNDLGAADSVPRNAGNGSVSGCSTVPGGSAPLGGLALFGLTLAALAWRGRQRRSIVAARRRR